MREGEKSGGEGVVKMEVLIELAIIVFESRVQNLLYQEWCE
jgi:hypothetical protein